MMVTVAGSAHATDAAMLVKSLPNTTAVHTADARAAGKAAYHIVTAEPVGDNGASVVTTALSLLCASAVWKALP